MSLDLEHLWLVASAANSDQLDRPWEWRGGYPQTITRIGDAVLIANTYESPDFPSTIAEFIATFDPPTVLELLRRGRSMMRQEVLPHRGDEVEAWIKRFRDQYAPHSPHFEVIDRLLDEYRMKSDYGLRLNEEGGDP